MWYWYIISIIIGSLIGFTAAYIEHYFKFNKK